MPSLTTFNANNFFLRYRFAKTYPGDQSRKSAVEAADAATLGYVPGKAFARSANKNFVVWDPERRKLAAEALKAPTGQLPEILCVQEVENMDTLRTFNETYLDGHYSHVLLIDGWDPRNIDVGVLSTFPIHSIRSYLDERASDGTPVFSRDCLVVDLDLGRGESLRLFVNHFKSKLVQREKGESDAKFNQRILAGHKRREAQARFVAKLVESHARNNRSGLFAVVGDFNDTPPSPWIRPLVNSPYLVDVLAQHEGEGNPAWTYYWRSKGRVQRIDYVLASQSLAKRVRQVHIERHGIGYREINANGELLPKEATYTAFDRDAVTPEPRGIPGDVKVDFQFKRYKEVLSDLSNNISDHCPVRIMF